MTIALLLSAFAAGFGIGFQLCYRRHFIRLWVVYQKTAALLNETRSFYETLISQK